MLFTVISLYFVQCGILNKHEAMVYLHKFGYTKNKTTDVLTDEDSKNAIEDYQKTFELPVTGDLNDETMEQMNRPRCGRPDDVPLMLNSQYRIWPKSHLTYKLKSFPRNGLSRRATIETMARAFNLWEQNVPLTFERKVDGKVNIDIQFLPADSGDGPGKTLAYAYFPERGDAYFDDENWTLNSRLGQNLLNTATHEFGHSLGLTHSKVKEALMYPYSQPYDPNFRLHSNDINRIQSLYGVKSVCDDTKMDAAFSISDKEMFAIKGNYCWKFKNRKLVAKYPKSLNNEWPALTMPVEAAFYQRNQIYFIKNGGIFYHDGQLKKSELSIDFNLPIDGAVSAGDRLYLFSGLKYWRYDRTPEGFRLKHGFPKDIASFWKGVPPSIDGVYYDQDRYFNFFKGSNVYIVDQHNHQNGATIKKKKEWMTC